MIFIIFRPQSSERLSSTASFFFFFFGSSIIVFSDFLSSMSPLILSAWYLASSAAFLASMASDLALSFKILEFLETVNLISSSRVRSLALPSLVSMSTLCYQYFVN